MRPYLSEYYDLIHSLIICNGELQNSVHYAHPGTRVPHSIGNVLPPPRNIVSFNFANEPSTLHHFVHHPAKSLQGPPLKSPLLSTELPIENLHRYPSPHIRISQRRLLSFLPLYPSSCCERVTYRIQPPQSSSYRQTRCLGSRKGGTCRWMGCRA